jgi:hypothetical protein
MPDEPLPIVIVQRTPGLDTGAKDTLVRCVNDTTDAFHIAVQSSGFLTIDDDGTMMQTGPADVAQTLQPGESAQIGDVVSWEWDGHVGLSIRYTNVRTGRTYGTAYNLKHGIDDRPVEWSIGVPLEYTVAIGHRTELPTQP